MRPKRQTEGLMPERLGQVGDGLILLCALIGIGSFALTHVLSAPAHLTGSGIVYWGCALAVVFLPPAHGRLTQLLGARIMTPRSAAFWVYGLELVPLVLWPIATPAHWLLVVLTLLQSNLITRQRTVVVSAWMLALAPLQVLASMAALPDPVWLLVLPLALVCCTCALVFLSARYHFERIEKRSARPFVRAWLARERESVSNEEVGARLRTAVLVALALMLVTAVSYPLLVALPRPSFNPRNESFSQAGSTPESPLEEIESSAPSNNDYFPGDIRPGGALGNLSYETVMTVAAYDALEPKQSPGYLGPLYLRAICLDTFTTTGLRSNRLDRTRRLGDGSDGSRDGWTQLARTTEPVEMILKIRQNALRLPTSEEILLFAAHPALAVQLDEVRYDPDRFIALPRASDVSEFEFTLRVGKAHTPPEELALLEARHEDSRFLQLPASSKELAWIAQQGRELMRGATSDLERVSAVLEYFHENYGYSTKTGDIPGVDGIANFMRREKGHCTSFASAATLLLRTAGIPARVATGFLANDYSDETGLYNVTRRNGHAWMEVHFDGVGWQRFEPTPSERRRAALLAEESGADDGLAAWGEEFMSDLKAWVKAGANEAYLGQLLQTLADLGRAALVTFKDKPWLIALPILGGAAWILLRRRTRRHGTGSRSRSRRRRDSLLESLLAALAERGHHRPATSTLREFMGSIELESSTGTVVHPGTGPELLAVVELFYRERFGAQPLQPAEIRRVRSCIEGLRSRKAEPAT